MSDLHWPTSRTFYLALLIVAGLPACGGDEGARWRPSPPQRATAVSNGANISASRVVEHGRLIYQEFGCAMCHGEEGRGGVKNLNAQTGGEIPKLIYVAEGYTPEELKRVIRDGVWEIARADSTGPVPPYRMPGFEGWMSEKDVDRLTKYLISLFPKGEEEKW